MTRFFYWKKKYLYAWKYSLVWKSVSLMLFALLVLSCRTTKVNTSARLTDSLSWNRKVSVTPVTIPSSLVELAIPMDSLRKLPEGAAYTKRSGQATLTLRLRGDSVHGVATCDSLQRLVYELEERLRQAQDRTERAETIKEPVTIPFRTRLKWYLSGVLTGIILVIIIRTTRKWTRQDR